MTSRRRTGIWFEALVANVLLDARDGDVRALSSPSPLDRADWPSDRADDRPERSLRADAPLAERADRPESRPERAVLPGDLERADDGFVNAALFLEGSRLPRHTSFQGGREWWQLR
jgi:hypothetical protein